jgi:hypothetical protein
VAGAERERVGCKSEEEKGGFSSATPTHGDKVRRHGDRGGQWLVVVALSAATKHDRHAVSMCTWPGDWGAWLECSGVTNSCARTPF